MSVTEALLTRNSDHSAEVRAHGGLAAKGAQKVAVVACMDSRVDVFATLRLAPGGSAPIWHDRGSRCVAD